MRFYLEADPWFRTQISENKYIVRFYRIVPPVDKYISIIIFYSFKKFVWDSVPEIDVYIIAKANPGFFHNPDLKVGVMKAKNFRALALPGN